MAINVDVTLRRLVYEFEQWANAHGQINDFGYGKYLEVFRTTGRNYAALIINCPNATSDKWYINYNFEIICLDYVRDEKDNKERANSDTQQIIRDLENTARYSNRWQEFCRIDSSFNYQKIDEYGADKAFGWLATFTMKVKRRHGICNIQALMPSYDFETGTIALPGCESGTVRVNGTSYGSVASGGTIDIPVQNSASETASVTVDPGSKIIIPNVSWTDSDGSAQSTKYGGTIQCTPATPPITDIIYVRDFWQAGDRETDNGSLGWYLNNTTIFEDTQPASGLAVKLDPNDSTLLSADTPNKFGNLNRVTNDKGGQNYDDVGGGLTSDGATANVMLDNYTNTIVYRQSLHAGTQNWNDSVVTAQAFTLPRYDGSTYNQWQMLPPKLIQHYLTGDGQNSHIFDSIDQWSDEFHWMMGLSVGGSACYFWRENQPWNATNIYNSFSRTSVNAGIDLIVWANAEDYV